MIQYDVVKFTLTGGRYRSVGGFVYTAVRLLRHPGSNPEHVISTFFLISLEPSEDVNFLFSSNMLP